MLHADWPIKLGKARPDQSSQPIKHLAAMLFQCGHGFRGMGRGLRAMDRG